MEEQRYHSHRGTEYVHITQPLPHQEELGSMIQVAGNMKQLFSELGGWGISDLQAALSLQRSTSATVTTRLPSPAITDLEWLTALAKYAVLVRASYKMDKDALMKELAGTGLVLVECHLVSEPARPALYIALDSENKEIILVFRGTGDMSDVITDALASKVDLPGGRGQAHKGMFIAASYMEKHVVPRIQTVQKRHPGFKLRVMGHSLGAGTAALFAVLTREIFPDIRAVLFATPACLSLDVCESLFKKDQMITVVFRDDLVPRFSTNTVDDLRSEILSHAYKDDARIEKPVAAALAAKAAESLKKGVTTSTEYARSVSSKYDLAAKGKAAGHAVAATASAVKNKIFAGLSWFSPVRPTSLVSGDEIPSPAKEEKPVDDPVADRSAAEAASKGDSVKQNVRLFPPGTLYHIVTLEDGSMVIVNVKPESFGKIIVSSTNLEDHKMTAIQEAISTAIENVRDPTKRHEARYHEQLPGSPSLYRPLDPHPQFLPPPGFNPYPKPNPYLHHGKH